CQHVATERAAAAALISAALQSRSLRRRGLASPLFCPLRKRSPSKGTRRIKSACDGMTSRPADKKTAGPKPRRSGLPKVSAGSAQQLQHALLRRVGKRERGRRDRLAGRQRLAVGRFL